MLVGIVHIANGWCLAGSPKLQPGDGRQNRELNRQATGCQVVTESIALMRLLWHCQEHEAIFVQKRGLQESKEAECQQCWMCVPGMMAFWLGKSLKESRALRL